jgi:hydroxyacylglutathione hydrolase
MYQSGDLNEPSLKVHLWLENRSRFDLGNYSLEIIHTPGHTSGSICIYELNHKMLFTGDTVFAGGTLSYISESGSLGDYINSIEMLSTRKISEFYPGHGATSNTPEDDMQRAIQNARALLKDQEGVELADYRDVS